MNEYSLPPLPYPETKVRDRFGGFWRFDGTRFVCLNLPGINNMSWGRLLESRGPVTPIGFTYQKVVRIVVVEPYALDRLLEESDSVVEWEEL